MSMESDLLNGNTLVTQKRNFYPDSMKETIDRAYETEFIGCFCKESWKRNVFNAIGQ